MLRWLPDEADSPGGDWRERSRGWMPAALALAALAGVYMIGREARLFDWVGRTEGVDRWFGATGLNLNYLDLGLPVGLRPGEALAAEYRVRGAAGRAELRVAPVAWTLRDAEAARVRAAPGESGTLLFVAERADVYGFDARSDPLDPSRACRSMLRTACAAPDLGWTVTWRRISAEDASVMGSRPDVRVVRLTSTR